MSYYLYCQGSADILLKGNSIIEAVENNFSSIAKECSIGNAAGYYLIEVSLEYSNSILGGKGGAVVTVIAQGSEALVNYDEEKDPPKTYTAWIGGVTEDELPKKTWIELTEKETFDLFDDNNRFFNSDDDSVNNAFKFGCILGLFDYPVPYVPP